MSRSHKQTQSSDFWKSLAKALHRGIERTAGWPGSAHFSYIRRRTSQGNEKKLVIARSLAAATRSVAAQSPIRTDGKPSSGERPRRPPAPTDRPPPFRRPDPRSEVGGR